MDNDYADYPEGRETFTLEEVTVGLTYDVTNQNWRFKVLEVLPDKVVINYTFEGGSRTMTLDKNEYHDLTLWQLD